jgi:hypothetical protein
VQLQPAHRTRVQQIVRRNCRLQRDRQPHLEIRADQRAPELLRRDADDLELPVVDDDRRPDRRRRAVEPPLPQTMTDDRHRRAVRRLRFRVRKRAAQRRRHAEHVEIITGDERAEDLLGRPPVGGADVQTDRVAGDQRLERLRAVAQVAIVGIRIAVGTASATLTANREELVLPDHTWQRVPQHTLHPAEDDRGGAHAERERDRGRDRHPRPCRERTCSIPDVVEHEPSRPPRPDPSVQIREE